MVTLHSLPHDVLRHIFGKLHLHALARLAITDQAWSATITTFAQDGNLEAITRWRAVLAALNAGAGGTVAAKEEQELQAQRRLDLLEHVPHLITDGGVKPPEDQGSFHRMAWDNEWKKLVDPGMYRTHETRGERICSAVFHLHGHLRWELSRQIHELLCALCLRASPADAIRLVQDIPASLGAAWCDESEHRTSILHGAFMSHASQKSWQPPSASVLSMLRRVEWTPALALTLHTTVFVLRQGGVRLRDFSVIANATHLLRRLNSAASPDVWFAETSSLIEDGASEGEAVALLLARSRVGKILQFEDEADDGTDALDWDLDSVQERRAESAAELAAQVATLPVRSMAVIGSRGSLEPPASSLAVCPRAQWPTRLTTKRVRVRAGALARHLAEEDFDLLDEHQQSCDVQYPEEEPWRYEDNWFPSATAFMSAWAEAAAFPLQCDDACRRALVQELTRRPQGHARYQHGLFDVAVRSIILGWVSKVARAGQDVESLLPGKEAAS